MDGEGAAAVGVEVGTGEEGGEDGSLGGAVEGGGGGDGWPEGEDEGVVGEEGGCVEGGEVGGAVAVGPEALAGALLEAEPCAEVFAHQERQAQVVFGEGHSGECWPVAQLRDPLLAYGVARGELPGVDVAAGGGAVGCGNGAGVAERGECCG